MKNFNDDAIREAAYYIWQSNGCPANTSSNDWNAAIMQLNSLASGSKKSASKASVAKMTTASKKSAPATKSSASKKLPQILLTSKKSK